MVERGRLPDGLDLAALLRTARVRAVFQPIVATDTQDLVGTEALARLQAADGGVITPGDFIPTASVAGLLDDVLAAVLASTGDLLAQGGLKEVRGLRPAPYVAVNVVSTQLEQAHFVSWFRDCLEEHGLSPDRVVLELSESEQTALTRTATHRLNSMRELGVALAIDDLGTGYSNLSSLISLAPEILKIDRSIVLGLPEHPWMSVVAAVVQMADSVGARVVAEGIETAAQLSSAQQLGVHAVQGYLLGRPSVDGVPTGVAVQAPSEWVGRAPRVALVDDDPQVLALMSAMLSDDGFDVVVAEHDAGRFLSMLRNIPVDIAVADLVLEGHEDGLRSVIRPLRHLRPDIVTVVFSSATDALVRGAAEDLGARWVDKTAGIEELIDECIDVVNGSSRRLRLAARRGGGPPPAATIDAPSSVHLRHRP